MGRTCARALAALSGYYLLALAGAFNTGALMSRQMSSTVSSRRMLSTPRMVSAMPKVEAPGSGTVTSGQKKRLHVQLGDAVYDLTGWRRMHPAGNHWIDRFADKDATDVMRAFHSETAYEMLEKLPKVRGKEAVEPNQVTKNFREFRKKLVSDGWFDRVWYKDVGLLAANLGTFAAGIAVAKTNPLLGTLVMAVGHTTGGWFAHDMVHGRGKFCSWLRHYGALTCGLSSKWWSEKHNLHHAFTNVVGVDEDIMVEPALWLWTPDSERDRSWRKYQHLYWPLPFSLTFLLWRIDSVRTAIAKKLKLEGSLLAVHYALLGSLVSLPVAVGHIFLGGLLTATLVTVTHTAEEYVLDDTDSFVETQFKTTRDAACNDPLSEYLWGGMQYQLEHHLFPTMPRYKYSKLAPLVKKFAEDNGIEYRVTGQWKIIQDNINLLKRVGSAPVDNTSPPPGAADINKL